jgi:hypothetical protein
MHLLLAKWSTTAAWVMTAIGIYAFTQFLGFLKSITKRPFVVGEGKLYLRYGILSETTISIENVESIDITTKSIDFDSETKKLSPLGNLEGHNVVIRLKKENTISGLYGVKRRFKTLALYVDNREEFKKRIEVALKNEQ